MLINKELIIKNKGQKDVPFFERLLDARNITSLDDNITFDPFLINDMDLAVSRIKAAIDKKEKIMIYGDYDGDGVTATSIMIKGLKELGVQADYYIPERLIDGYGMNMHSCAEIADAGYQLVITVDCGITSFEEIDYFNSRDIDVVVTDHHKTKSMLPNAYAVLDNQREDNTYPFPDICGAMMAYKLITALYSELGFSYKKKDLLILAAMGTITDVMPLTLENRTIVKGGLEAIKQSTSPNIGALLKAANKDKNSLTAVDIGFYIGPLINASSRIGNVHDAVNIFISEDEDIISKSAKNLVSYNEERKKIEKKITTEAMNYVMNEGVPNGIIVACGEGWHKGVIGIACSRLVDKFFRPAIVLSLVDGKYTGSCRSIEGINIMDVLDYAKDYISGYGGHVGAAGLSVEIENIEGFKNKINEYSEKYLNNYIFKPKSEIEMEIFFDEITIESFEQTKKLEPFGTSSNPEPVFACKDLVIKEIRKIGKTEPQEHLSIVFTSSNSNIQIKAVGFFMSSYFDLLHEGDKVNLTFKLNKNEFNGLTNIQMMIEDVFFEIQKDETQAILEKKYNNQLDQYIKENNIIIKNETYIKVLKSLYKIISRDKYKVIVMDKLFLKNVLSTDILENLTYVNMSIILEALKEAGFINISKLGFNNMGVSIIEDSKKRTKISETEIFKKIHNE